MILVLMRHGEADGPDHPGERGLTEKGVADVRSVSDSLRETGYDLGIILHSGKKRAARTAAILAERAGKNARIEKIAGLAPHDDVEEVAVELGRLTVPAAVVGHMPHLVKLISHLCGQQEVSLLGTAHAAVLERRGDSWEAIHVVRPASPKPV